MNTADGDPAPPRPYRTRTWVLFARDVPVAVILRRGPKRVHRLIRWNLKNDTFEPGQWMAAGIDLSDLSPDGSKLLYRAAQYRRPRSRPLSRPYDPMLPKPPARGERRPRAYRRIPRYLRSGPEGAPHGPRDVSTDWTAISVPPYFTALAFWPSFGRWTGGGRFESSHQLALYESADGMTPIVNTPVPRDFRVRMHERGEEFRPSATYPAYAPDYPDDGPLYAGIAAAGLRNLDWVTGKIGDDLLFAADGIVYRLRQWRTRGLSDLVADAHPLVDLRDMAFEAIAPPPWARRW